MTVNYSMYFREKYNSINSFVKEYECDLFISAFNNSERVQSIFKDIKANKKHWLIFSEYNYSDSEVPENNERIEVFSLASDSESKVAVDYLSRILEEYAGKKICIDITGFVRPYLLSFVKFFNLKKITMLDVVYSEPSWYEKREETEFSRKVLDVRVVEGYSGIHEHDTSRDLLLVGSGYDDKLISAVANNKLSVRNKIQLFGLPALSPIMYQENRLRAHRSSEDISSIGCEFAPAYDPFATAQAIKEIVAKKTPTNLYLCPLATKPQTLGFALYYLLEEKYNSAASIIHPYYESYSKKTSQGVGKIWKYTIEF